MTCREASKLLPLFFDGELDARQMRTVALHDTRCPECEPELRRMERLQELISDTIHRRVDETDFRNFWPAIEAQLDAVPLSWWGRVRAWWNESEHGWAVRAPVFVAACAIAVLALLLLSRVRQPNVRPDAAQVAAVDNSAAIDELDTDVDAVTMLNDPETRTTVIWVTDNTVPGDFSE